jgi:hypothetical protein
MNSVVIQKYGDSGTQIRPEWDARIRCFPHYSFVHQGVGRIHIGSLLTNLIVSALVLSSCSAGVGASTPAAIKPAPGYALKHALAVEVPTLLSAAIEQGTFTCILGNEETGVSSFRVTFTPPTPFTSRAFIDPQGWTRTIDAPDEIRLEKSASTKVSMFLSFTGAAGVFHQAVGGFEGSC